MMVVDRHNNNNNKLSLPLLLKERELGMRTPIGFWSDIASFHSSRVALLEIPEIASPHKSGIPSLCMDRTEHRFLLAGGMDAIISIYDLSKWGKDEATHHYNINQRNLHKPVAQSLRVAFNSERGHASSIVAAQWHPVDTGAFLSGARDGAVLVWDTQAMTPVVKWKPMENKILSCLDLSRSLDRSLSLVAIGSFDTTIVKLLDMRSGGASHSLLGHMRGITQLKWSPTCDVILMSGGLDGTIRLWDIRKSGSRACMAILNRNTHELNHSRRYQGDYAHLRKKKTIMEGPNNYHSVENKTIVSHGGPISAMSFTPDGHFIISTGKDGKLQVWDLRTNANLIPLNFHSHGSQPPIQSSNKNVPLLVQNCGKQTIAWTGNGKTIYGFDVQLGGKPVRTIQGHLDSVTCLETMEPFSFDFMSGGMDGMILSWGRSAP